VISRLQRFHRRRRPQCLAVVATDLRLVLLSRLSLRLYIAGLPTGGAIAAGAVNSRSFCCCRCKQREARIALLFDIQPDDPSAGILKYNPQVQSSSTILKYNPQVQSSSTILNNEIAIVGQALGRQVFAVLSAIKDGKCTAMIARVPALVRRLHAASACAIGSSTSANNLGAAA
jgi:hypothetical protein